MDEYRAQRVSDAIREELAEIVAFEMEDPRLQHVDVTWVEVSPDLRHAHVRAAIPGAEADKKKALAALDHATNFLRRELAARLSLRRVPELHFSVDPAAGADNRVEILLRRVKKASKKSQNSD